MQGGEVGGEIYLWKVCCHHSPVCELPASQGLECFCCGVRFIVLNEDLSDSGRLPASARRPWDFDRDNVAKFRAFFPNIIGNFCCFLSVCFQLPRDERANNLPSYSSLSRSSSGVTMFRSCSTRLCSAALFVCDANPLMAAIPTSKFAICVGPMHALTTLSFFPPISIPFRVSRAGLLAVRGSANSTKAIPWNELVTLGMK